VDNTSCGTNSVCLDGVCKLLGGQCPSGEDSACVSNHCADGYCCDAACNVECDRCNLTGSEGTCLFLAEGEVGDCLNGKVCNAAHLCDVP